MNKTILPLMLVLTGLVAGCNAPRPSADNEPGTSAAAAGEDAAVRPRLVVLVIIDQFGAWVLEEHLERLPSDGLLRRAYTEGTRHTVAFPYANTATAAGHATLVTGVTPAQHGIHANAVHDHRIGRRKTVDDRRHAVIGNDDAYAGPDRLRVSTVADQLHEATNGEAGIVALSMKARAAVLASGRSADLAVFYDEDIPGLTTSTFYRPEGTLPPWLQSFNREQPVAKVFTRWEQNDATTCDVDDAPGEGPFRGWGASFPHDPAHAEDPGKMFAYTPASTGYLFEAARHAVDAEGLGQDDVPDLLIIGVSSTDKIGHVWGPRSCEYIDNLLRTDAELTAFAAELEAQSRVSFVITSDHGVSPLPEETAEAGGRLVKKQILAVARRAAASVLGEGDWVAGYESSNLYLTRDGEKRREELVPALQEALTGIDGIGRVYDSRDHAALARSDDPVDRLAAASLPEGVESDLLIVPARRWFNEVYDVPGGGSNHGTPWEYDREVPVLMWGTGIERSESEGVADARRLAATLTTLLGVEPPPGALTPPLTGVLGTGSP